MIYIVRHGKTDWNILGKRQGHANIPLNDEGIKQANEMKERLQDINFDFVYSSPLDRAVNTAKIITGKDPIIDERLIERNNGDLEGLTKEEIEKLKKEDDYSDEKYNVESPNEMQKRADSFMSEILEKHPDKNILIVSHGGLIVNIRCYLDGIPDNLWYYFPDNCEVYTYNNEKRSR